MSDSNVPPSKSFNTMRSPVRPPVQPAPPVTPAPTPQTPSGAPRPQDQLTNDHATHQAALADLRQKTEALSDDFANGRINKAQFQALYKKYSESRSIIERLIERNPQSDAWRNVPTSGYTGILMPQFEAKPVYFMVFSERKQEPLLTGGDVPVSEKILTRVMPLVWKIPNRPTLGLGRKQVDAGQWMIMATGAYTATGVIFSIEPSINQARLVRDLHADFERANQAALARGWLAPDRMVFPQRALFGNG